MAGAFAKAIADGLFGDPSKFFWVEEPRPIDWEGLAEEREKAHAKLLAAAIPNPAAKPLSLAKAKRQVRKSIDNFMRRVAAGEENFQQATIATPGIGKTRIILAAFRTRMRAAALTKGDVLEIDSGTSTDSADPAPGFIGQPWYLAPTVRLAKEAAGIYGDGAAVVVGRTYTDETSEALCGKADVVEAAAKAGVHAIAKSFCYSKDEKGVEHVCELRAGCPYYAQFDAVQAADVVFGSHELASLTMSRKLLPEPGVVIIDENFSLVTKTRRFSPDVARKSAGPHLATIEVVLAALADGRDPRDALRGLKHDTDSTTDGPGPRPWTRKGVGKIARELEDAGEKPLLYPGLSDQEVRERLKVKRVTPYAAMLLRRVAAEWSLMERPLYGVTYWPKFKVKTKDDGTVEMPMVELQHRRQLHIAAKVPVLLLDGTAEDEMLRAVWPNIEVTHIEAPRRMHLTQVIGRTLSSLSFFDRDHKPTDPGLKLVEEISGYLTTLPTPGVLVAQKEVVALFKLPAGWTAEHFGALRGLDAHRDAEVIVVLGRMLIRAGDAARTARGMYYDSEVQLKLLDKDGKNLSYVKHSIRLPGREEVMYDWRHPDPLVDLIRAAAAEREIEQAVDRLRHVHATKARQVILISEVPTRLPINVIARYADLIHDKCMVAMRREGGFLPMRATWLAKWHPELWATVGAARLAVYRAVPGAGVGLWRFRVAGKGGPHPTLCWAATGTDKEDVRAFLVRRVGQVTMLERHS